LILKAVSIRLDFILADEGNMESTDLFDLAEALVRDSGLLLVDLSVKNTGRTYMIRLLVDRPGRVSIRECAELSRKLQDAMDENLLLMNENYRLEVGSPGIGRLLSTEVDWVRSVGRKLSVETPEEQVVDWLEAYDCGVLKFREGLEVPVSQIMRAVEVLD
jgi:ribosome maturation factor RimP